MASTVQGAGLVQSSAGPRPIERASALPLWAQVHDDLRRRLACGEFACDFPGELALAAAYGVSRHTVREALRRLRADGVVIAERGRLPRVGAPPDIRQSLGALYSLFASVEAQGVEQRSIVRQLDTRVNDAVASRLGLSPATELFYLERLRLADGEPLALDRSWLPASLARPLLHADFSHTALYAELARLVGVHLNGGEEHLHAVVPSVEQRKTLGLARGVAAFSVDRIGRSDDRPIEWRETLVRADRFSVTANFSTRTGYHLDIAPAAEI